MLRHLKINFSFEGNVSSLFLRVGKILHFSSVCYLKTKFVAPQKNENFLFFITFTRSIGDMSYGDEYLGWRILREIYRI